MEPTPQLFQYESINYSINVNDTVITIQILKGKQVEAEQSFTMDQLKQVSFFFNMFSSLQSAHKELICSAEQSKVSFKEKNEFYLITFNINLNVISSFDLVIPKQMNTPQPIIANVNQSIIKEINQRFDQTEFMITKRLDQQEIMINTRFDSIDKQLQLLSDKITVINQQQAKTIKKPNSNYIKENCNDLYINSQKEINMEQIKQKVIILKEKIAFLIEEETILIYNFLDRGSDIKWKLLYHPSIGQDTLQEIAAQCNNKPHIVVLIETRKGCKFGGYTSIGWGDPPKDGSSINILFN